LQHEAMNAACSAVSTIGTMMPMAPTSSMRAMKSYSVVGTRTKGAMPRPRHSAICWRSVSVLIAVCSMS